VSEDALGRWPVVIETPIAWGDMDAFQHVNNTVYLRWCESARIAYFERLGLSDRLEETDIGPILARASVDFRLPLTYPGKVSIATTVTRIGTTSFTMRYRITSAAHNGAVAAEGEGVVVLVDYREGDKVPLSVELRAAIHALEATA
jgi:acyl-CoA thioester hydrolase